ncbi:MAG: hypothetical protein RR853_09005 [Aurantimicrobium sp.]|uniref:hypothetical protein n=1 Tax=Aurantimicrobium sp. TaxID=1930784 RepID=UPI002FC94652
MKNIAYTGSSDARFLNAEDIAKAGVDITSQKQQEFMFQRFISTEVTNDVADALVSNSDFFGGFEEVKAPVGQRFNLEQLDFSSIESQPEESKPAETGEVIDTPQTGIDSAAPKRTARSATA